VPDEEDSLAALLEEEAEAALRVVRKAVGVDFREEVRCGAREALARLSRNHSFVLVGCGKRRLFAGLTNAKLARRLVRWLFLVEKPKTSYRASPKFPARCELDIFILLE
jgi:hypothetical protein